MTAPSIKEALEPCPFCGDSELNFTNLSADATQQFVFCESCHGRSGAGNGREEATQRWNTRALTASVPGEQQPVEWPSDGSCVRCGAVPRTSSGLCNTCLDEDAERSENSPPPAAGWNEAIEAAKLVVERWSLPTIQTPSMWLIDKAGIVAEIESLRREAPAPEGVEDAPGHTDLMVTPESIDAFMEANPLPRPDAGGGVREALFGVMAQAESDLAGAHAEICKLQNIDPAQHTWPDWSPQANTLRWFKTLRDKYAGELPNVETIAALLYEAANPTMKWSYLWPSHNHLHASVRQRYIEAAARFEDAFTALAMPPGAEDSQ